MDYYSKLVQYQKWPNAIKGTVSGALSGFVEIWFTFPFEYVKTQIHLDDHNRMGKYTGAWDCFKKTVKADGIRGLYHGFQASLLGNIPKSATRFGGFELARSFMDDEHGHLSNVGKVICGLSSGICESVLAATPAETLKIKYIHDRTRVKPQFKNFLHGVQMIVKQEGLRGLYQGLGPTMAKQCSNQTIRFWVVERLKDSYRAGDDTVYIPNAVVGLFGSIGGGTSVLINTPTDVIKSRMQSFGRHKYKSSLDCAVQMWKREGIGSFYSGFKPRMTRVCLDEGLTFMLYDWLMELFQADD